MGTSISTQDMIEAFRQIEESDVKKPALPIAMVKHDDGVIDVTCSGDRHLRVFPDEDRVVEL